jgi:predicted oxidoreductase (fatty acid repression mutant protein)
MESKFLEAVEKRRSYRVITNQSTIKKEEVIEIAKKALEHTPTAFNSQSPRLVMLFEQEHIRFWKVVKDSLLAQQNQFQVEKSIQKINELSQAFGTILFYEETSIHVELKAKFPKLVDDVQRWVDQGQGMIQYIVWTALSEQGLGASLQHYNGSIDDIVTQLFDIPPSWKLIAQMPFGKPVEEPREKKFTDINTRFIVKDK